MIELVKELEDKLKKEFDSYEKEHDELKNKIGVDKLDNIERERLSYLTGACSVLYECIGELQAIPERYAFNVKEEMQREKVETSYKFYLNAKQSYLIKKALGFYISTNIYRDCSNESQDMIKLRNKFGGKE